MIVTLLAVESIPVREEVPVKRMEKTCLSSACDRTEVGRLGYSSDMH